MAISAGNPVRLDKWQNIVGVSWPGIPIVAAITSNSVEANIEGPLILQLPVSGPGPLPEVGDLLVAKVAYRPLEDLPGRRVPVVLTPSPGWTELFQDSIFIPFIVVEDDSMVHSTGVWSRYVTEADLAPESGFDVTEYEWTHNESFDGAHVGIMIRVSGARTSGFPVAFSQYIDDGGPADPGSFPLRGFPDFPADELAHVTIPGIDPGGMNRLLLSFVSGSRHDTELLSAWPGDARQTALVTVETDPDKTFGFPDVWARAYSETWESSENTGDRTITNSPRKTRCIASMVAIR